MQACHLHKPCQTALQRQLKPAPGWLALPSQKELPPLYSHGLELTLLLLMILLLPSCQQSAWAVRAGELANCFSALAQALPPPVLQLHCLLCPQGLSRPLAVSRLQAAEQFP